MLNRLFTLRSAWAGYKSAITVSARRAMQKQRWLLLGASLLILASPPGRADDDHERARQALENRQILPLRTILERVEKAYPGAFSSLKTNPPCKRNSCRRSMRPAMPPMPPATASMPTIWAPANPTMPSCSTSACRKWMA